MTIFTEEILAEEVITAVYLTSGFMKEESVVTGNAVGIGLFGTSGASLVALYAAVCGVSVEVAVDTSCAVADFSSGACSTGIITVSTQPSLLIRISTNLTLQHTYSILNV